MDLQDRQTEIAQATETNNAGRLLDILKGGIHKSLEESNAKGSKHPKTLSPFKLFRKKDMQRLDLPLLIEAGVDGDGGRLAQTYCTIIREDCRGHFAQLRTSNAGSPFELLPKEDSRKPRGVSLACAAPLRDSAAARHSSDPQKCGLLVGSFAAEITAPKLGGPHRPKREGATGGNQGGVRTEAR